MLDVDIVLFIFRIVVQLIIYIICYIGNVIFHAEGWWNRWLGQTFLWCCNFNNFRVRGFEIYQRMLESDKKFIIVTNHISLWDGFILMAALGNLGFISSKKGAELMPGMKDMLRCFNSVIIEKGKTIERIIEHVNKRKKGDNPLVMFADAMEPIPKGKNIAPFKTGAFVGKFDILPVIIKYKNYSIDPKHRWYEGENIVISVYKMLLDGSCDICVEVLEPVSCGSLSINEYKDKVYDVMDSAYIKV
jgi:1-acyl-sn-glycerol-3-phosphate acyltransferase